MKNITKTFDLILIELLFIGFFISITSDSFEYYFRNKFFEGYQIVGGTVIFAFLNIPLLILLLIRKDLKNFKAIGLFTLAIFIIGFIGFKIPLIVLPPLSFYAIFYIGRQFVNRIRKVQICSGTIESKEI